MGIKFAKTDKHYFFSLKNTLIHYGNEGRKTMTVGGDRNNEEKNPQNFPNLTPDIIPTWRREVRHGVPPILRNCWQLIAARRRESFL